MTHVVYIILNHDTNQAYTGLTKQFAARISQHRRKKSYLFEGRCTVVKTEMMPAIAAQRKEADAVRYLQTIGYHTVNVAKTGSLGQPPVRTWTKERCAEEAEKYTTRWDFQRKSLGVYLAAYRYGWLNDICKHMKSVKKPCGYWTKERCAEEAQKYTTRNDFQRKSAGAFEAASKNGWLDDIRRHMKRRTR